MLTRKVTGWILVANSTLCRIFTRNMLTGKLDIVREFISEDGRLLSRSIGTDKPGRTFDSAGEGRHAMEPKTTFHHQAREAFARKIADFLNEAVLKDSFHALTIAASTRFLGAIRPFLNQQVQDNIVTQINKDLTHIPPQELVSHLYQKAG